MNQNDNLMTIDEKLLEIIACPKCKGNLYLNEDKNGLICEYCRLIYEIREGIPILLIDEAKSLE